MNLNILLVYFVLRMIIYYVYLEILSFNKKWGYFDTSIYEYNKNRFCNHCDNIHMHVHAITIEYIITHYILNNFL